MKTWIAGLFVMVMLAGCASVAQLQSYNGRYFLTGDAACTQVKLVADGDIWCYDKKGNFTSVRSPLSSSDLQVYAYQQEQARQERADLNEQLRQGNQYIQAMSRPLPSYSTPQVQGIPAQGTTTYNQVGDTLIGTNGTSCQTVGQTTVCR